MRNYQEIVEIPVFRHDNVISRSSQYTAISSATHCNRTGSAQTCDFHMNKFYPR
jgi:hypothetical protein